MAVRNRILIVNSRFLQRLQKRSSGNQLIHRRLSKSKSIGRGQNKRLKQADSQMLMVDGVWSQRRRPGAEFGGRTNFSRTKISELRFLGGKISIFMSKNSDDFFSHPPGFSDFDSLSSDSPYLYCVKCRI